MKLLFDQNISFRIKRKVDQLFPGCCHVSDCNLSDAEDYDIWKYARNNGLVIVTYDADFHDLSMINGHPPKIIWIRSGNLTSTGITKLLYDNLLTIKNFIENEAFKNIACLQLSVYI